MIQYYRLQVKRSRSNDFVSKSQQLKHLPKLRRQFQSHDILNTDMDTFSDSINYNNS
jgi:hypothetical protein